MRNKLMNPEQRLNLLRGFPLCINTLNARVYRVTLNRIK